MSGDDQQDADRRENAARLDRLDSHAIAFASRMTGMARPAYGDQVPPAQATVRGNRTEPTRCGRAQYAGHTSGARPPHRTDQVRSGAVLGADLRMAAERQGSAGEAVQAEQADVVARVAVG